MSSLRTGERDFALQQDSVASHDVKIGSQQALTSCSLLDYPDIAPIAIHAYCFVAASSLRANCLVAMRSSAVSLIPHERNPGMQRFRIQKTECAESERRNARLGNGTWI